MSNLLALLPADGWPRFLCDVLWQSTLLVAVGWTAAHLLTRRAVTQASILMLTFIACAVAPLLTLAVRLSDRGLIPTTQAAAPKVPEAILAAAPTEETTTVPEELSLVEAAPALATSDGPSLLAIVAVVWGGASLFLLARFLWSAAAVTRILRRSRPCSDLKLLLAADAAARSVGLSSTPAVLVSDAVNAPMVFGLGKPRLLVPSSPNQTNESEKEIDWLAVFSHELAHVGRRDAWARLAVEALMILVPVQPLLWLARRDYFRFCEEACDDWAVACGSDPLNLAATLTEWLDRCAAPPAGAISVTATKARVLRLLAIKDRPVPGLGRAYRIAAVPLVIAVTAALALAQTSGSSNAGDTQAAEKKAGTGTLTLTGPNTFTGAAIDEFIIQPRDVLEIRVGRLEPRSDWKIQKSDTLNVSVAGTNPDEPINGAYEVQSDGKVVMGATWGSVRVDGLTRSEAEDIIRIHLQERIRTPQVTVSIARTRRDEVVGKHTVGPDGTILLGKVGRVNVNTTSTVARQRIEEKLSELFENVQVAVTVELTERWYYVVFGVGADQVTRHRLTSDISVLDVVSEQRLIGMDQAKIWINRVSPRAKLDVDWKAVIQGDDPAKNYRILPGDRVVIQGAQREAPLPDRR